MGAGEPGTVTHQWGRRCCRCPPPESESPSCPTPCGRSGLARRPAQRRAPHMALPADPPPPAPCRFCGAWRISGRSTRSCTEVRPTGALAGRRGWRAGPNHASPAGSAPRCEAVQHPRQLQRRDQAVRLRGERAAHRLHGQLLRGNSVLHVCKSLVRCMSVTCCDPSAPPRFPGAFAKGFILGGISSPSKV